MKKRSLTEFGHSILRTKARNVTPSFLKTKNFTKLVKEMRRMMHAENGIGIAAPQVGVPLSIALIEMRPTPTRPNLKKRGPLTIVNPVILHAAKAKIGGWEGCLSFKGVRGNVARPRAVEVSYLSEKGERVREKATGLWARLFQHEVDHLNGILYVDRMADMKTLMTLKEFKKRVRG